MSCHVSVLHSMTERSIIVNWVTGPSERDNYWKEIKLSTARKNERQLKQLASEIEATRAPVSLKCYVIHFCDQSFCYQREWEKLN